MKQHITKEQLQAKLNSLNALTDIMENNRRDLGPLYNDWKLDIFNVESELKRYEFKTSSS